jgi:transcriptional regulator with XRE-family HTH domain
MNFVSSKIFTKDVRLGNVEYINLFGVRAKQGENLADYLRQKLKENPSLRLRGIAERSGGGVTHSYLSKLMSGAASNPSVEKLEAISEGLGVPYKEVLAATEGKSLTDAESFDSEIYVAFMGFEELSDEDKAEMLATVRMLGSEIQRRRPKKPKKPPDNKGKGKGKK